VRGGIGVIVGFRLDDASADVIDEQAGAEEIARNVKRVAAEEIRTEAGSRTRPALSDER
jgi:hypothetical protein